VPALRLEWRETARSDLLSIVDYISDHNPDAAQRLKDEIEAKVSKLPERPLIYRSGRVVGTREMVVRPNYVVVYSVTAETVAILRVLHAARQWPPGDGGKDG
jgi:toxin ParE1/3/4